MYRLDFSHKGRSSLLSLDKKVGQKVLDKLKWLTQNINDITLLPLKGKLSGLYKLRVGEWRIVYEINHNDKVITVHKIGHRKEIYR